MYNDLQSLLYIKIPADKIGQNLAIIKPDVPLPIQKSALFDEHNDSKLKIDDITPEMILAGMLTVFAYDRENVNIKYYRELFNILKPNIKKEMIEAAIIKTRNGDFDAAEEILLALEGLDPFDNVIKLNLALLMEEHADFCEAACLYDKTDMYNDYALELYEKLILSEPPLPKVFFNAAFFFAKIHDYRKAKSLLTTYIQIEKSNSENAEIRKSKAENLLNSISSQSLDDALFQEAHTLINTGKTEDAIAKIKLFLQKNQKSWNGWFLLGWALRKLNRWGDAKVSFLKSLELLKKYQEQRVEYFSNILNELSICCMEMKRFDEAEEYLLNALSMEPENIKIISNLGILSAKQGNKEKADAFFRTVLEINPNDKIAAEMIEKGVNF